MLGSRALKKAKQQPVPTENPLPYWGIWTSGMSNPSREGWKRNRNHAGPLDVPIVISCFPFQTDNSDIVQLVKSLSLISLWMTSCAGISAVLPPITFTYVFSLESTEIQVLSIHHRKLRIRQGPTSHLEACWPCLNQVRKAKQTVYIMSLAKHHSLRYEHMIEIGLNWKSQVKRTWPSNNKLINIRLRHKATSCKRSSRNHKKQ